MTSDGWTKAGAADAGKGGGGGEDVGYCKSISPSISISFSAAGLK